MGFFYYYKIVKCNLNIQMSCLYHDFISCYILDTIAYFYDIVYNSTAKL